MMNYKLLLFFSISFFIGSCSTIKKHQSADELKLVEYDQFIDHIQSEYAYLKTRIEEFNCIKDTYRNDVINITTKKEHIHFYNTILMELWDSHLHTNRITKGSYLSDYTIYTEFSNGATRVKNVWQSKISNLPIENIIGAEVISYNGIQFQELINAFPTRCQDKDNHSIRTWIGNKIMVGKLKEPKKVEFRLTTGGIFSLDLDSLVLKTEDKFLNYQLFDNIGYIRINNSLGEKGLVKEFNTALDKLMQTNALILDLRSTEDGGNTGVAVPILGRFISKKQPYQLYENKDKKYFGYVKPKGKTYSKPLYVLTNHWTGSMGEGMAVAFDGMKRGVIIGTEMERLRGGMKGFKFLTQDYSYKISFEKIFHIDGTPRENYVPKVYINQSQHIEDEILNKALEMAKKS